MTTPVLAPQVHNLVNYDIKQHGNSPIKTLTNIKHNNVENSKPVGQRYYDIMVHKESSHIILLLTYFIVVFGIAISPIINTVIH